MNRITKLVEKFDALNIDGVLISDGLNRRYLSGFTGSTGFLYISKTKKCMLTDFRYLEQVAMECPEFEIVDMLKEGFIPTLKNIIKDDGAKTIGFEEKKMMYSQYVELKEGIEEVKLVELNDTVEKIRMIKDEEEIENIKKASTIGDKAFEHILTFIKPGLTEEEVALELEFFMRKNGAKKLSFDTIVASGVRSSLPHAQPTDKIIEEGDFVTLDFGCIYNGYCSDMTRTIVIGKATDKQKEIYNTVLEAQEQALKALKAGLTGKEVDEVARNIIKEKGYGDNFGHGLGHSLGLFVHEEPRLSPKDNNVLQEKMIVTVEPGIYIPKFGGVRIEDLVCVTEDGIINFVSSPKELIEI